MSTNFTALAYLIIWEFWGQETCLSFHLLVRAQYSQCLALSNQFVSLFLYLFTSMLVLRPVSVLVKPLLLYSRRCYVCITVLQGLFFIPAHPCEVVITSERLDIFPKDTCSCAAIIQITFSLNSKLFYTDFCTVRKCIYSFIFLNKRGHYRDSSKACVLNSFF